MKRIESYLMIAILLLAFASCKSKAPAIVSEPTNQYTPGEVVWRELITPNPEAAAQFYKSLFGWEISSVGTEKSPYWLIRHNGTPIGGIVKMPASTRNATGEWICSVSVPSVDEISTAAVSNGASLVLKPTNFTGRGRTSVLKDPQGAPVAILRAESGDPVKKDAVNNGWLWQELWSTDVAGSEKFYAEVFKVELDKTKDDQRDYTVLKKGDKKLAGIVKTPVEGIRSHWMNYVKVSDPEGLVRKAQTLGARVLLAPGPTVRNGTLGIILDPTGAAIALQKVN
jgi:predicted enzyme related to lactoylglutathione lyase